MHRLRGGKNVKPAEQDVVSTEPLANPQGDARHTVVMCRQNSLHSARHAGTHSQRGSWHDA